MFRTINRFSIVLIVSLLCFACKASDRQKSIDRDTIILARSGQSFTIDSAHPFHQASIVPDDKQVFNRAKKTLLVFDAPDVSKNPDGVYEVYITPDKPEIKSLQPGHTGFVNLLDLYSLTAPEPPTWLSLDISWHLESLKKNGPLPPLFVSIVFRGTLLSGDRQTTNAGIMTVKEIRILQEK